MEIRRSYNRLISTTGFPILVRWHLYTKSGPWLIVVFTPYTSTKKDNVTERKTTQKSTTKFGIFDKMYLSVKLIAHVHRRFWQVSFALGTRAMQTDGLPVHHVTLGCWIFYHCICMKAHKISWYILGLGLQFGFVFSISLLSLHILVIRLTLILSNYPYRPIMIITTITGMFMSIAIHLKLHI